MEPEDHITGPRNASNTQTKMTNHKDQEASALNTKKNPHYASNIGSLSALFIISLIEIYIEYSKDVE